MCSTHKISLLALVFVFFLMPGCLRRQSAQVELLSQETKGTPEEPAKQRSPEELLKEAQSLEKDPRLDEVMHRFQKGIRLLETGKTEQAGTVFESLKKDHPGVSVFHLNLGVVYKRLGRLEDALKAYQEAIAILGQNPGDGHAEAYYNLGIVLREQGNFKAAEEAYRDAIVLEPDFKDAHFNLAVLYDLYLNDPAKAIHHYQKQIDLTGGGNEEIQIWIAALQKRLETTGSTP